MYYDRTLYIEGQSDALIYFFESLNRKRTDFDYFNSTKLYNEDLNIWEGYHHVLKEILLKDDSLFNSSDHYVGLSTIDPNHFIPMPKEILMMPFSRNDFLSNRIKYPSWFELFESPMSIAEWREKNWGFSSGSFSKFMVDKGLYVKRNNAPIRFRLGFSVSSSYDSLYISCPSDPSLLISKISELNPELIFEYVPTRIGPTMNDQEDTTQVWMEGKLIK